MHYSYRIDYSCPVTLSCWFSHLSAQLLALIRRIEDLIFEKLDIAEI